MRFAPIRTLFATGRCKHAPIAIEHGAEELLQCKRVKFATAAGRRVRLKHSPPVALANSLPAQFITYQTRNSVQSNGATSHIVRHMHANKTVFALAVFVTPIVAARATQFLANTGLLSNGHEI
jgi:hypothetical protein